MRRVKAATSGTPVANIVSCFPRDVPNSGIAGRKVLVRK